MQDARRRKRFLPEKDVINWANQLADALSFMHNQDPSIVHRDIKPSNMKLTPNGLLKLVDFGLVKILAPEEITITVIQGQGTALYTPLEQYGGDGMHTDVRADIYAFGATLYHLLTNESPTDARKRFLQPESLLPLRQINPSVSSRTERAVLWAMSLHPDQRPESIEILRQALLGTREPPTIPTAVSQPQHNPSLWEIITSTPDSILLWMAAGLFLLSLITTLIR
jgi:serine/threonine-protein kinase